MPLSHRRMCMQFMFLSHATLTQKDMYAIYVSNLEAHVQVESGHRT